MSEETTTTKNRYLTATEIQEILSIGKSKAYEILKAPIPGIVRIGGTVRIRESALYEWLESIETAGGEL